MESRPQGLTIVGIVCLVAGMLSACCNVWGLATTAAQVGLVANVGAASQDPAAVQLVAMQREMAIYTGVPAVLGVVAAMVLVAGAGVALAMKPAGRSLLVGALGGVIFVALLETALGALVSYKMTHELWGSGAGTGVSPFGGATGGSPFGDGSALVMGATMAMAGLWLVVKLGVYVPCLVYMLRAETATFFARERRIGARGD